MTVTTTTSRVEYSGDGSTTQFAVPFYFLQDDDLVVYKNETLQTIITHYSVSGAGNSSGGTITFGSAPASTDTVIIFLDAEITQSVDYINNDPFPAETHETALDRLTMVALRNRDLLDRALVLPDSETNVPDMTIPSLPVRANKVFYWGASGEPATANLSAETLTFSPQAQILSGDGSTTDYPLLMAPGSDAALVVAVGGTLQKPGVDFTVSGSTISFTSAPPSATNNIIVQNFGFAMGVSGTVADGTVTTEKIVDSAITAVKMAADSVSTANIVDKAVTIAKIQDITSARILGRTTAGAGIVEQLNVGGSLTLAGGTLSGTAATDSQAGVAELATTTEVQAGTDTARVPSVSSLRSGLIVPGSATSVGGLTALDYTSIPSWVKRITVQFHSFKPGGTSTPILQIGGSGGIETSSYLGATIDNGAGELLSSGFRLARTAVHDANSIYHGSVVLEHLNNTTWVVRGALSRSNTATGSVISGSHDVTTTLDRLRVTTVGGTDVWTSGIINIHYE